MLRTCKKLLAFLLALALVFTTFTSDYTSAKVFAEGDTTEEQGNPEEEQGEPENESEDEGESEDEEESEEESEDEESEDEESEDEESEESEDSEEPEDGEESEDEAEDAESEETDEESEASEEDEEGRIVITYVVDGEGGSVSNAKESFDPDSEEITLDGATATPDEGFEFVSWTGGYLENYTDATLVPDYTKIEEDVEFTANFKAVEAEEEEAETENDIDETISTDLATVLVQAGEGVFPEGTIVKVSDVDSSKAFDIAKKELDGVTAAKGVDISFEDADGVKVQPADSKKVHVEITFNEALEGDSFVALHEHDDIVDNLGEAKADGTVFDVSSFSPFVIAAVETEEEVEYPAKDFSGSANGLYVKVSAPEGAFPADTEMVVTGVDSANRIDAINNAISGIAGSVKVVDISFYLDGVKIEPKESVDVSITNYAANSESKYNVVHIEDGGSAEVVAGEDDIDGKVANFETDSFSEYAYVELVAFTVRSLSPSVEEGANTDVYAVIEPDDAVSDKSITWTWVKDSSDSTIKNVVITSKADGRASITATGTGNVVIKGTLNADPTQYDTVTVLVTPILVKTINVSVKVNNKAYDPTSNKSYVTSGSKGIATADVEPETAANKDITWKTSDSAIATIDSNGNITFGDKEGVVTITASNEASYAMGTIKIRVLKDTPGSASAIAYQTNGYKGDISGLVVPTSWTPVSEIFEKNYTFGGVEYTFTGSVLYNSTYHHDMPEWSEMREWSKVTALRYDSANRYIMYRLGNGYEGRLSSGNRVNGYLYPLVINSEECENIGIEYTDWGYTDKSNNQKIHNRKTVQLSMYNTCTNSVILDPSNSAGKDKSGVIRYDNDTNDVRGGFTLDVSESDYYNVEYRVYKTTNDLGNSLLQDVNTVKKLYNGSVSGWNFQNPPTDGKESVTVSFSKDISHEHYVIICVIAPKNINISYAPGTVTNAAPMPDGVSNVPVLVPSGGKAVPTSYTVSTVEPVDPEGKNIFVGWLYNDHLYRGGDVIDAIAHSDMEFVAQWVEASQVLGYAVGSGRGNVDRKSEVIKTTMLGSNAVPETGYHFVNWTDARGTVVGTSTKFVPTGNQIKKDVIYYANFAENPKVQVSVSNGNIFEGNTSVGTSKTYTVEYNNTISVYTKPNDNHVLNSIKVDNVAISDITPGTHNNVVIGNDGKVTVTFSNVTSNHTVSVEYIGQYTVKFNLNGGKAADGSSSIPTQYVNIGGKAQKPANPVRTGYKFVGWFLNGTAYNFDAEVTGNITLVAKWTQMHKVTFDTQGGSPVPPTQEVEHNNTASKPADPKKDGYSFKGWTLGGKAYDFSTKVTTDITLVASWKKIHTVKFVTNGGAPTPGDLKVEDGEKATKPSDPTKTGYEFAGWYKAGGYTADNKYNFNSEVTSDITLYAAWNVDLTGYSIAAIDYDDYYDGKTHNGGYKILKGNVEVDSIPGVSLTAEYSTTTLPSVKDATESPVKYTVTITATKTSTDAYVIGTTSISGTVNGSLNVKPIPVKVSTNSKEQKYNGSALTATGLKVAYFDDTTAQNYVNGNADAIKGQENLSVEIVEGETLTFKTNGTRTIPGETDNTYEVAYSSSINEKNYKFDEKADILGKLKVTIWGEDELIITADSGSWTYDGTGHSEAGYTVTKKPTGFDEAYEIKSVNVAPNPEDTRLVKGEVVNVTGSSSVKNKVVSVVIVTNDGKTAEVPYKTVDGDLTITPAKIKVTPKDASKTFGDKDPKFESKDIEIVSDNPTQELKTLVGNLKGSFDKYVTRELGEDAKTYKMSFNSEAPKTLKDGNIEVTYGEGTFTIKKYSLRGISLKAASAKKPYDGTPLTAGLDDSSKTIKIGEKTFTVEAQMTEASTITHVLTTGEGTVPNVIDPTTIAIKDGNTDVTTSFDLKEMETPTDGTLEITPAPLTIMTASASKMFDGRPLVTEGEDAYRVGTLYGDDAVKVTITGSQTLVNVDTEHDGNNTFAYEFTKGSVADYAVEEKPGTLTVTGFDGILEITAVPNGPVTRTYTGSAQTGFTYSLILPSSEDIEESGIDTWFDGEAIQPIRPVSIDNVFRSIGNRLYGAISDVTTIKATAHEEAGTFSMGDVTFKVTTNAEVVPDNEAKEAVAVGHYDLIMDPDSLELEGALKVEATAGDESMDATDMFALVAGDPTTLDIVNTTPTPGPSDDDTPSDPGTPTTTIPDAPVATAPAPTGAVLGAQRDVPVDGPAVLGARRAGTDDSTNRAARAFVILVSAAVALTLMITGKKKKEED